MVYKGEVSMIFKKRRQPKSLGRGWGAAVDGGGKKKNQGEKMFKISLGADCGDGWNNPVGLRGGKGEGGGKKKSVRHQIIPRRGLQGRPRKKRKGGKRALDGEVKLYEPQCWPLTSLGEEKSSSIFWKRTGTGGNSHQRRNHLRCTGFGGGERGGKGRSKREEHGKGEIGLFKAETIFNMHQKSKKRFRS